MKYVEIFSRDELLGMTKKQIANLAKYYGVDTNGVKKEDLIDALFVKINGKPDEFSMENGEEVQMSVRVKRAYGG